MQLASLRPLYDHPGPFVSLHVDVSRDTEDARQQIDARWTRIRHELERQGVAEELAADIGARLHEPTHLPGPARRTLVAVTGGDEAGTVVFDDVRAGAGTWPDTIEVGPLPDVAGWLALVDGQQPFVLVRADRSGADVETYAAASRPAAESTSVEGDTFDLTKLPEGDWAQDKYQQRAENTWHANMELVAGQVRSLIGRYRPRLVVVCGDVRARSDLVELLDEHLGAADDTTVVAVDSGGRAAGTSDDALWADVRRLLAEVEARETNDLVHRLERGVAVGEGVVEGPDRVADAFVAGGVERLVLDLGEAHEATLTAADHPGLTLPAAALEAGPLPADQVLVAAAALTDAEVSVLPHEIPLPRDFALSSGVAATLRWDDRTPPADG